MTGLVTPDLDHVSAVGIAPVHHDDGRTRACDIHRLACQAYWGDDRPSKKCHALFQSRLVSRLAGLLTQGCGNALRWMRRPRATSAAPANLPPVRRTSSPSPIAGNALPWLSRILATSPVPSTAVAPPLSRCRRSTASRA